MKKLLVLFLAVSLLICSAAAEDVDLSGMSFEDLVALKERINLAIWNSQEWQEVKVPAGIWEVGKDIPAGQWQISPMKGSMADVFYCEKADATAYLPDFSGVWYKQIIASETNSNADRCENYVVYELQEGWFIINNSAVFFTPYTGKPDLGFN